MGTLSKNLESFVAALEPAARELGSLQLRWISSVPSSSAISDLDKSATRSTLMPHLVHHLRMCVGMLRSLMTSALVPTTRRGICTSPMSVTEMLFPSQDSPTGLPEPDSARVTCDYKVG